MDTVVLKFGGSSVADNIKLNVVAEKVKKFYDDSKRVVVVVSAQGKTTDSLIKEALSLSSVPNERELDVLLSSGEQISMAKLSILLNRLEIPAVSLTGWQAGIYTNNTNQNKTTGQANTNDPSMSSDRHDEGLLEGTGEGSETDSSSEATTPDADASYSSDTSTYQPGLEQHEGTSSFEETTVPDLGNPDASRNPDAYNPTDVEGLAGELFSDGAGI